MSRRTISQLEKESRLVKASVVDIPKHPAPTTNTLGFVVLLHDMICVSTSRRHSIVGGTRPKTLRSSIEQLAEYGSYVGVNSRCLPYHSLGGGFRTGRGHKGLEVFPRKTSPTFHCKSCSVLLLNSYLVSGGLLLEILSGVVQHGRPILCSLHRSYTRCCAHCITGYTGQGI